MYEVNTRTIPERRILCLKRHVNGEEGAWAMGKEFIGMLRDRDLPRIEGREGATFCIYWGEVSADSDGPLEWCRPVPADQAESVAAAIPELTSAPRRRTTRRSSTSDPQARRRRRSGSWCSESLRTWAHEHAVLPLDLGVRITYLVSPPIVETSRLDCDFAVPMAGG